MKFKVTVELDEGTKGISNVKISDEAYLIGGEELVIEQVQQGAKKCIRDLLDYFKNGGKFLHTFNQLVKDGHETDEIQTYMRCCLKINDIREIEELNKQACIPMTLEEIEVRNCRD